MENVRKWVFKFSLLIAAMLLFSEIAYAQQEPVKMAALQIDEETDPYQSRLFRVHPDLTGKPIALLVDRHLGASEIYLNGEKMYELGEFSTDPESVVTYSSKKPVPIVFSDDEIQTLAVRFINPEYAMTGRLMGYNGFRFLLGDWQTHQDKAYSFVAGWSSRNMFYIGMLLAFAVNHFLLFVFYSSERRNLYFSVFVGLLAALTYFYFRMELNEHTIDTLADVSRTAQHEYENDVHEPYAGAMPRI